MIERRARPPSQARLAVPSLAVAVSAAGFCHAASHPAVGVGLVIAAFIAWAARPWVRMDEFGQGVGTLVTVIAAVGTTTIVTEGERFTMQVLTGCALTCLAIAVFRLAQPRPRYGQRGTIGIALIPLIVAGALPASLAYVVAAIAMTVLAAVTMVLDDPSEPDVHRASVRRRGTYVVFGAIVAVVSIALVGVLPAAQRWALQRIISPGGQWTGFGHSLSLDALTRLMQSERLVLRMHGRDAGNDPGSGAGNGAGSGAGNDSYLRGAVYTWYQDGDWRAPRRASDRRVPVQSLDDIGPGWIEVERVQGSDRELLLPLQVAGLALTGGPARGSVTGLVTVPSDEVGLRWAWRPARSGGESREGESSLLDQAPPMQDELRVPDALREPLAAWLEQNVGAADAPATRVADIARALRTGYRYSLTHARTTDGDPVIDFLQHNPVGHCEYFASAQVLLSRAAGVPARVVGGYLVTETNPWGGFHVVRERDAHAWAEVWLDGRWQTVDATPPGSLDTLVRHRPGEFRLFTEWAMASIVRLWNGLGDGHLYALVAVLGALLLVLRVRALRALRRVGEGELPRTRPLPCFDRMAGFLAAAGLDRRGGETLHAYADRIEASAVGRADDLARWMRAYAAWRYGGEGDPDALDRSVARLTESALGGARGG